MISPLLANLYMNRFLKHWRQTGRGESLAGACRQLCGRLRHPQPRTCGGGAGVDAAGDDPARADPERNEDLLCAMHGRSASTSWATASGRTATGRMATGIWGPVRRRRACNASRHKVAEITGARQHARRGMEVRDRLNHLLRGWCDLLQLRHPADGRTGRSDTPCL